MTAHYVSNVVRCFAFEVASGARYDHARRVSPTRYGVALPAMRDAAIVGVPGLSYQWMRQSRRKSQTLRKPIRKGLGA
jgi:hypothetical protein